MKLLDNVAKNPLIASRARSTAAIGLETLFGVQHRVAPPNHGLARDKSVLNVDAHTQGLVKGRQSAAIAEARGCLCNVTRGACVLASKARPAALGKARRLMATSKPAQEP